MKVELDLKIGTQTNSGRIFSRKVLETALLEIEYPILVDLNGNSNLIDLQSYCGNITNIEISDNKLEGIFDLDPSTPQGQMIESIINSDIDLVFRVSGTGLVNSEKEVTEYSIHKVFIDNSL